MYPYTPHDGIWEIGGVEAVILSSHPQALAFLHHGIDLRYPLNIEMLGPIRFGEENFFFPYWDLNHDSSVV